MIESQTQHDIVDTACKLLESGTDWVKFYREILGLAALFGRISPPGRR